MRDIKKGLGGYTLAVVASSGNATEEGSFDYAYDALASLPALYPGYGPKKTVHAALQGLLELAQNTEIQRRITS